MLLKITIDATLYPAVVSHLQQTDFRESVGFKGSPKVNPNDLTKMDLTIEFKEMADTIPRVPIVREVTLLPFLKVVGLFPARPV